MNIYFILWVLIQYDCIYFVLQIVPALAAGSSFSRLPCSFDRLILYISCPSSKISHFSQQPWFLLLEKCIRNQDLGTGMLTATRTSLLLHPLSWGSSLFLLVWRTVRFQELFIFWRAFYRLTAFEHLFLALPGSEVASVVHLVFPPQKCPLPLPTRANVSSHVLPLPFVNPTGMQASQHMLELGNICLFCCPTLHIQ